MDTPLENLKSLNLATPTSEASTSLRVVLLRAPFLPRSPWVSLHVSILLMDPVEKSGVTRLRLLRKVDRVLWMDFLERRPHGKNSLTLPLRLHDGAAVLKAILVIHLPGRDRSYLVSPAVPLTYISSIFAVSGLSAFVRFIPRPPPLKRWTVVHPIPSTMLVEAYSHGPPTGTTTFLGQLLTPSERMTLEGASTPVLTTSKGPH